MKKLRGTALMSKEKRTEIAKKGGIAVSKNREQMSKIGMLGGAKVAAQYGQEHFRRIGRMGGKKPKIKGSPLTTIEEEQMSVKKLPESGEVYYIRTTAIRGRFDELFGFLPNPEAKEFQVSSLLTTDAAVDKKRWKDVLATAGAAFHKAFSGNAS